MEYITVRQFAEKWGISERRVQKYCAAGRIPGARKFGVSWEIPADVEKPEDPRRQRGEAAPEPAAKREPALEGAGLMPLLNTPFQPGHCLETIRAMLDGPRKDIAWAEYHYFSGQAEQAVREVELHLADKDMEVRLSACLIYAYANLSLGQIQRASYTLNELNRTLDATDSTNSLQLMAAKGFAASAAAVLLHLPLPENLPPVEECLPLLPPGLRAFSMYVHAHYIYLQGDYAKSLGVVEATLAMQNKVLSLIHISEPTRPY